MGHLKTARGLGVWDMLGGGFLSSLLKHSKMDDAQQAMQYAQQELQDFSRELADVQMYVDVQVNFDGLTRFVDMFCDSFFVDWMVQDQIVRAQENVAEARSASEKHTLDAITMNESLNHTYEEAAGSLDA